jgi:hypothetical protein
MTTTIISSMIVMPRVLARIIHRDLRTDGPDQLLVFGSWATAGWSILMGTLRGFPYPPAPWLQRFAWAKPAFAKAIASSLVRLSWCG